MSAFKFERATKESKFLPHIQSIKKIRFTNHTMRRFSILKAKCNKYIFYIFFLLFIQ